jgi:hypothetical protein
MNSTMEHTAPNITDNGEDNATNQQMVANENNNNNN